MGGGGGGGSILDASSGLGLCIFKGCTILLFGLNKYVSLKLYQQYRINIINFQKFIINKDRIVDPLVPVSLVFLEKTM